jgi:hypothetical protein
MINFLYYFTLCNLNSAAESVSLRVIYLWYYCSFMKRLDKVSRSLDTTADEKIRVFRTNPSVHSVSFAKLKHFDGIRYWMTILKVEIEFDFDLYRSNTTHFLLKLKSNLKDVPQSDPPYCLWLYAFCMTDHYNSVRAVPRGARGPGRSSVFVAPS